MGTELAIEENGRVSAQVREELARRRLSRQWLADTAKISISTLEKALAGRRPFSLGTVIRIEEALDLSLRHHRDDKASPPNAFAPEDLGAYARPGVSWLEGEYLTLRPSFSEVGAVFAYQTLIAWDDEKGCLRFREKGRVDEDYKQEGFVSFPHLSGHIYLVTNTAGQYRLILLGRPGSSGAMCGVLTTLVAGAGSQLTPAAAPITLIPSQRVQELELGVIRDGDHCFEEYRSRLNQVAARGFATFPV